VTLSGPARQTTQSASFAGDDEHAASTGSGPFEIRHEDSTTALSVTRKPATVEAEATLTETDSGAALAGRTVRFLVNGEQVATAQTNDSGQATATFAVNQVKSGDVITAVFDGDTSYLGSQDEESVQKPGVL
jgi:hypothetical protein